MLLGDVNSSVRVHSPSSSRLSSASVPKALPSHHSRLQVSSRPSHRCLSSKAIRPRPLVLEPRSSSSVPPLQLSVSRPVRPARLFHLTKRGVSSRLPWSASLDATEAWGSGTKLLNRPLLSEVDISRAKRTIRARIEVSGYVGVHLRGNPQQRSRANQLLGNSPINSII
ncbi:hypothetical protein BDM02DRAFT_2725958 [Thelephora ganbajun]|uniref:Uncharacterized protein n=1 Tax=Thelephora ganbajun TaxID=370292 RepID=A0ACB6ZCJ5_THEGA|nr:hypothetical protein BDM02DRAFT_2725958 [Thelephora ganbajun]